MNAGEVTSGVSFPYHGTTVTALRDAEPTKDRWGQDLVRFWATRADTGAEGWMTFGPANEIAGA